MIITRTPMRISFFGGGTDLPNYYREFGGAVLSATIDKYLYITCRQLPPYWEFKHQLIYGSKKETVNEIQEIDHPSIRETMRFLNIQYGLDMHYSTDIPARSGMGSSSSFTVGLLQALYGLEGKMVSKRRLAAEAIHIEQNMIKEAVGSQDQVAAAFGGLNYIKFQKDDSFDVRPVTIGLDRMQELNKHLILIFTGLQRYASRIEAEKIKNLKEKQQSLHEMRKMTEQAIGVLNSETDIREFGALMNDSWNRKKELSDQVSNSVIDQLYSTALKHGAEGGKVLGAGGGGFMLFFVEPQKRQRVLDSLSGFLHVPFSFDKTGSQVIYYREEQL